MIIVKCKFNPKVVALVNVLKVDKNNNVIHYVIIVCKSFFIISDFEYNI